MKYFATIFLTLLLMSCATSKVDKTPMTPAKELLHAAHQAHGGDGYYAGPYSFTFRGKRYSFDFDKNGDYTYTVDYQKDGKRISDALKNDDFSRRTNGEDTALDEKGLRRGKNGLNSVVYFATLPHKLLDPAVNVEKMPDVAIRGKSYEVLKVTFDQEGGGDDHDDTYYYWIDANTHKIDYLAYDFHVGRGGVRFRSAYNRKTLNGVTFQDYINYKAPKGTALDALPTMYENGELEELSRVETEHVTAGY